MESYFEIKADLLLSEQDTTLLLGDKSLERSRYSQGRLVDISGWGVIQQVGTPHASMREFVLDGCWNLPLTPSAQLQAIWAIYGDF